MESLVMRAAFIGAAATRCLFRCGERGMLFLDESRAICLGTVAGRITSRARRRAQGARRAARDGRGRCRLFSPRAIAKAMARGSLYISPLITARCRRPRSARQKHMAHASRHGRHCRAPRASDSTASVRRCSHDDKMPRHAGLAARPAGRTTTNSAAPTIQALATTAELRAEGEKYGAANFFNECHYHEFHLEPRA